eukprot:4176374-Karenia_brevis.AAC.1
MPVYGYPRVKQVPDFRLVDMLKILGCFVKNNGSIVHDFDASCNSMWISFWAQFSKKRKVTKLPNDARIGLVNRACKPHFAFKWATWPLQKDLVQRLRRVQGKAYALALKHKWKSDDTPASYRFRRYQKARSYMSAKKEWSTAWVRSCQKLYDHVCRAHVADEPANWLVRCRCTQWLQKQREAMRLQGQPGRTGTRARPGAVTARWEESLWAWGGDIQQLYNPRHDDDDDDDDMYQNLNIRCPHQGEGGGSGPQAPSSNSMGDPRPVSITNFNSTQSPSQPTTIN